MGGDARTACGGLAGPALGDDAPVGDRAPAPGLGDGDLKPPYFAEGHQGHSQHVLLTQTWPYTLQQANCYDIVFIDTLYNHICATICV